MNAQIIFHLPNTIQHLSGNTFPSVTTGDPQLSDSNISHMWLSTRCDCCIWDVNQNHIYQPVTHFTSRRIKDHFVCLYNAQCDYKRYTEYCDYFLNLISYYTTYHLLLNRYKYKNLWGKYLEVQQVLQGHKPCWHHCRTGHAQCPTHGWLNLVSHLPVCY